MLGSNAHCSCLDNTIFVPKLVALLTIRQLLHVWLGCFWFERRGEKGWCQIKPEIGDERGGERCFVCGWFGTRAERKRPTSSRINLIMDITMMVIARLRRDERHEPRGGGWSL